jgi:hypothetical protein
MPEDGVIDGRIPARPDLLDRMSRHEAGACSNRERGDRGGFILM